MNARTHSKHTIVHSHHRHINANPAADVLLYGRSECLYAPNIYIKLKLRNDRIAIVWSVFYIHTKSSDGVCARLSSLPPRRSRWGSGDVLTSGAFVVIVLIVARVSNAVSVSPVGWELMSAAG